MNIKMALTKLDNQKDILVMLLDFIGECPVPDTEDAQDMYNDVVAKLHQLQRDYNKDPSDVIKNRIKTIIEEALRACSDICDAEWTVENWSYNTNIENLLDDNSEDDEDDSAE